MQNGRHAARHRHPGAVRDRADGEEDLHSLRVEPHLSHHSHRRAAPPVAELLDPTYMGDSIGRWDGDTFVVDVIGFNDKTWLPGAGHFHSGIRHVVERYTLQPNDTIFYEATMEDPKVFTKPWQYRLILRHPPRDERIMEAECQENNQDLEHIVPGHLRPKSSGERVLQ